MSYFRGRNIFAIQQNLAGITMTREVALDRARQYFDLLNRSFEVCNEYHFLF